MTAYYLRLGFAHLRRHPVLTLLMVLTLAVGIAASMSTLTVLYMMSADPIPEKSTRLLVPNFDYGNLDDLRAGQPPEAHQLNYLDTRNLLASDIGAARTALYSTNLTVFPPREDLYTYAAQGLATTRAFFAMFQVPMRRGAVWSEQDDVTGAPVVILSRRQAERLYGDRDPVGERLRLGQNRSQEFTIVGVIDNWTPQPHFHHIYNGMGANFSAEDDFFLPLRTAVDLAWANNGNTSCWGNAGNTREEFLASECVWLQFWFEAATAADRAVIASALDNYVNDQKKLGRFLRPLNNRLFDVNEWLAYNEVVSNDSRLSTWLAFGFLLVCMVNLSGLLLAKFSRRAGEIGVRRALGARKRDIFFQFSLEALVIGLSGGGLGLLLSFGGLWLIGLQSADVQSIARMDLAMLLTTFALATTAAVLAALVPTWRACQITPALQLKSQ